MQQPPPTAAADQAHAQFKAAGADRAQAVVRALVEQGLANRPWHLWLASPYAAWCLHPYSHDLAELVGRWAERPGTHLPAALQAAAPTQGLRGGANLAAAAQALAQTTQQLWQESEHVARQVGIVPFVVGDGTGHIIDLARLDLAALAFGDCRTKQPPTGVLLRLDGPPAHIGEAWELTTLFMLTALQQHLGQLWHSCSIFAHASLPRPGSMKQRAWQPGPHARLGAQLRRSFPAPNQGSARPGPSCHWYDIDTRLAWQGEYAAAQAALLELLQQGPR